MCLCPVSILNPKKRLAFGVDKFLLQVPCGHCRECNDTKQNEWLLRTYYESLHTLEQGGFVLTDCLTYNPKFRPRLSRFDSSLIGSSLDFDCFDRSDVRHFLVRLRSELTRLGYDYRQGMKYFLTSEYGADVRYSHAPHYHIAFFVTFDISPFVLSELIHKCWQKGFTDGLPFKSKKYLIEKNHLIQSGKNGVANISAAIQYVCKYVTKDSYFQKEVDDRIDLVVRSHYGDDYMKSTEGYKYFKYIKHKCNEFHLQSPHLGECALSYCDNKTAVFDGYMRFPTSDQKSFVKVATPMYFKRKLLYELREDFRGSKTWQLTDYGKSVRLFSIPRRLACSAQNFADWYENCSDTKKLQLLNLLAGRSWYDFAKYVMFYKGALVSSHQTAPSFQDFDELLANDDTDIIYNYTSSCDNLCLGYRHLSFLDYSKCPSTTPTFWYADTIPVHDFCQRYVINENTFPQFHDFDRIFSLYSRDKYKEYLDTCESDLQISILSNKLKNALAYD